MTLEKIDYGVDELLKDEKILDRFVKEIDKKVAGEKDSIRAILLHLFSAWVKNITMKNHLLVNSESSAGKSFVCNAIRLIFPKEFFEYRTKITPEALTYWKQDIEGWDWNGKILYLEDIREDVLNSPTFKIMASEGSVATVVIKQKAYDIKINGSPVMLLTSAKATPNAEIVNRFGIINLDESNEQTEKVIERQLKNSALRETEKYNIIFTEAIRRLLRCSVRIPDWINNLIEHIPIDLLRIRRDMPRFLDLIKASAIIHQNQREFDIVNKVIWANEQDYEIARDVMDKIDEAGGIYGLTHRNRKCLETCRRYFKEFESYFSAQEIYAYEPVVSEKMWKIILDKLAEKKLLNISLRKPDEESRAKKPTTTFYPNSSVKMVLPSVKTLKEIKVIKPINILKEKSEKNKTRKKAIV